MSKTFGWISLFLFLLIVPVLAASGHLPLLLADLQSTAKQTRTLTSDFVQEKHLSVFNEVLSSQGRFVYQQPDHLRWELLTPVHSGFILQDRQGVSWNGLSGETRHFEVSSDPIMGTVAMQLLAWARMDLEWLQQRYRLELVSEEPVSLNLFPRDAKEADFIDHLQIRFAADRGHLEQVRMVEQGGDSTLIRFERVAVNAPIAADAFDVPEK